ncbi:hypothetical protein TeGR_g2375, partial [Tetraparma gracilis]
PIPPPPPPRRYVGVPVLGSKNGMPPSYAYFVMTVSIFVRNPVTSPLDFLEKFLETYAAFDWSEYALTIKGPIKLSDVGKAPAKDVPGADEKEAALDNVVNVFADFASLTKTSRQWIQHSSANIVDPVDVGNNLGLCVPAGNLTLMTTCFSLGLKHLRYLKEWAANGMKAAGAPWTAAEHYPFMWTPATNGPSATNMSELDVEALDLSKPPKRKVADPIICKYSGRTLGSLEELKMWHQTNHWLGLSFFPSVLASATSLGSPPAPDSSPPATPPSSPSKKYNPNLNIAIPEHMDFADDCPNSPSTPLTPVNQATSKDRPMTPQQGRPKSSSKGREAHRDVEVSDLAVSISMVSHACRLAGIPKAVPLGDSKRVGKKKSKSGRSRTKSRSRSGSEWTDGSETSSFESIESTDENYRVE